MVIYAFSLIRKIDFPLKEGGLGFKGRLVWFKTNLSLVVKQCQSSYKATLFYSYIVPSVAICSLCLDALLVIKCRKYNFFLLFVFAYSCCIR